VKTLDILTDADKETLDLPRLLENEPARDGQKKLYIESYGCQMNFSDSEIVASILREQGFAATSNLDEAHVILLNTCAIRDNAEQKVRNRLSHLTALKRRKPETVIGVLGCMAERLKTKLLEEEKAVDMVVGPDAYRDLPRLVEEAETGQKAVNVFLSREETYADIAPVRLNSNGVTAFVSIMRGCDNMCSFCVVPYTRGRERSRDPHSIVREARDLFEAGYREVTLLGQNVDSYKWEEKGEGKRETGEITESSFSLLPSPFSKTVNFATLLALVADISPDLRVRFSTSHPKDITDEVLYTMARYPNVCKYIHLPAQSGNSRILSLMNRTYDRDWYLMKISRIREILGEDCGISHDLIAGFCTETEDDHRDTLSLMEAVQFDFGFMFYYSERPGTPAAKKLTDDVPLETKKRRLNEIIALQQQHSLRRNQRDVGRVHRVLVEGCSKRSDEHLQGRNDQNKVVIFPRGNFQKGQYVDVLVTDCTAATLLGTAVVQFSV
jgi:tRNA-2-methylthio-N6-dimethylallyladenosine synthase